MTPEEKWPWKEGMSQLSGFGGGYEEACQKMLRAGLQWLEENPEADPLVTHNPQIYDIVNEENQAAKDLSAAVMAAIPDCSGAMHQAAMSHCLYIKKNGWENYVEESIRRNKTADDRPETHQGVRRPYSWRLHLQR